MGALRTSRGSGEAVCYTCTKRIEPGAARLLSRATVSVCELCCLANDLRTNSIGDE